MGLATSFGSTMLTVVWGLVELMLAGVIAGWLYREAGGAAAAPAARQPAPATSER